MSLQNPELRRMCQCGTLDTLSKVNNALQEGVVRGNNLTSKLRGANQRLELL